MTDVASNLQGALERIKSSLTVAQIKSAARATYLDITEDNRAHGLEEGAPFWDMVSDERTHVFIVFGRESFEIFAFESREFHVLISALNMLSMSEVTELKQLLLERYGVRQPSVSMVSSQALEWLNG